jgi:hypothetical protein
MRHKKNTDECHTSLRIILKTLLIPLKGFAHADCSTNTGLQVFPQAKKCFDSVSRSHNREFAVTGEVLRFHSHGDVKELSFRYQRITPPVPSLEPQEGPVSSWVVL